MGKKKKFFNNSYALNKPYRGPFFKKRINHTHLIREKRRTIFPKKNEPYALNKGKTEDLFSIKK